MTAITKPCAKCGEDLPLESFKRDARMRLGRSSYCRPCAAAYARERYARNPERARAISRAAAARRRTPEETRRRHIKALYGLPWGEYEALLAAQGGRCAICRTDEPGGKGNWHVDHSHDSARVRGLLCALCNVGLGYFRDDPTRLAAAIKYLKEKS